MSRPEIETTLRGSEFFKNFGNEEIQKLAALCRLVQFEQGDLVFQQGDYGDHLYIIAEGQIFLERSVDLGGRKGNVVIEALGKGRVFGSWSSLLGDPHYLMSTATCQKSSKIICMEGSELRKEMIFNKEIGFQILERLSFLLRDRIQAAYGALEKF